MCGSLGDTLAVVTRIRVTEPPTLLDGMQCKYLAGFLYSEPINGSEGEPMRNSGVEFRVQHQLEANKSCLEGRRNLL